MVLVLDTGVVELNESEVSVRAAQRARELFVGHCKLPAMHGAWCMEVEASL